MTDAEAKVMHAIQERQLSSQDLGRLLSESRSPQGLAMVGGGFAGRLRKKGWTYHYGDGGMYWGLTPEGRKALADHLSAEE